MAEKTDVGYITVKAVAALEASPVEGAVVTIRNIENDEPVTFAVRITDEDGKTDSVPVPTPPKSLSQAPGSTELPYSLINIETYADGYFSVLMKDVPVYPGITSVQVVNLIPLPDVYNTERYPGSNIIINEREAPNL